MARKQNSLYLISVVLFMVALPALSIYVEYLTNNHLFGWLLIGKWFIFWAVGIRLFGLVGILTLYKSDWTQPMAMVGGLYFGLAGIQHILKNPSGNNERIALISDLFIFVLIAFYLLFTL
jgi:hypothetical protein